MTTLNVAVDCPVFDSFRVQQIAGLFDVPLAERSRVAFEVDLPTSYEAWQIGVIVGPSGSGKSTVAHAAYGEAFISEGSWPTDRAVIDGFGDVSTREITSVLTAVGFSSPPSWIKPYHVLSNGEKFRCDLARALLAAAPASSNNAGEAPLVVFDEFTSVVDRTVARVGSAAVSRAIRGGRIARRFVAVTCHYDIVSWLEPDWVLDMATRRLTRGRLRRPDLVLEVVQCPQALWTVFARHHYLSSALARASTCYAALWNGEPVAFCATTGMFGRKGRKRITRIVALPDFQGLGIGMRLVERVCEHEGRRGFRCNITASHPSVLAHCKRSAQWRLVQVQPLASRSFQVSHGLEVKTAVGRGVVSFEYVPSQVAKAA